MGSFARGKPGLGVELLRDFSIRHREVYLALLSRLGQLWRGLVVDGYEVHLHVLSPQPVEVCIQPLDGGP